MKKRTLQLDKELITKEINERALDGGYPYPTDFCTLTCSCYACESADGNPICEEWM